MQGILFDEMYKLELDINKLTKSVTELLYSARSHEEWTRLYGVETLCRALTEIKCSISAQLKEECEAPFKD